MESNHSFVVIPSGDINAVSLCMESWYLFYSIKAIDANASKANMEPLIWLRRLSAELTSWGSELWVEAAAKTAVLESPDPLEDFCSVVGALLALDVGCELLLAAEVTIGVGVATISNPDWS